MNLPQSNSPAGIYRLILRIAAVLVPAGRRGDWLREWTAELQYVWRAVHPTERLSRSGEARVGGFCLGAFADAWWLRLGQLRRDGIHLFHPGSPVGCLLLLVSLAAGSLVMGLRLPDVQKAIFPSPYRDGKTTILIGRGSYERSPSPSIRLDQFRAWQSSAHPVFTDIAFYQPVVKHVRMAPHRSAELHIVRGSAGLFDLLGVSTAFSAKPGEAAAGGRDGRPGLVLSQSAWRRYFGADRAIAGRKVRVGVEDVTVIGVAPDASWRLPGDADAWLLYSGRRMSALPEHTRGFVVARLRPSAFPPGARMPWRLSIPNREGGYDGFEYTTLAERTGEPFSTFLFALALACLALPATTHLALGEYPANASAQPMPIRLRRWVSLSIKVSLVVPAVCFVSLDLTHLVAGVELPAAFAGCLFGLRWVLRDQRRRCPVCLRMLKNPARVGEPSRNFLAWNGIELMCEEGHGLLHVPEIATSWFSTQRWLYLDPSWESLFAAPVASAGV